ncbi:hypothetical protein BSIN_0271 [Burkholderia singularis]|uniref:Uncharacterized protein n=1 Tax=Burkholderia singularis TaxID=1503053 RepID=A0A238H4E7_9BURK|nr:hypothetical protein BSIN_0271 [Burkholderia singularis]
MACARLIVHGCHCRWRLQETGVWFALRGSAGPARSSWPGDFRASSGASACTSRGGNGRM